MYGNLSTTTATSEINENVESMSRFLTTNRNIELLEPYEGKLSRTVLRGEGGSNALDLPDIQKQGDFFVESPIILLAAIIWYLRIYLMYTFLFPGQYANVMGYAIVVSVSLFFSVILAKLVGGMLPLAAKKLGADPAIMATPFITTIVDACSLILYFQIAQLVFRNMM